MRRWMVVAVGVGGAIAGGLGGVAVAQEDLFHRIGLLASHRQEENFEVELGITAGGRPGLPQRVKEHRRVVTVPTHYGTLFDMTQNGPDTILWYRAEDGTIRNASLEGSAHQAYAIERRESLKLEIRLR